MTGRLIVVTGTGTEIGKTHFSEALLLALGALSPRVAGVKPVESGVGDPEATDAARLARASSFHVKHSGHAFADPVSPHLAARSAGQTIDVARLVHELGAARGQTDVLLVELPGGLFSPLSDVARNADLARDLGATAVLLVAPDRLGVLHDVLAARRAATTVPLVVDRVVLMAPAVADASTGRNADELRRLLPDVAVVGALPRASAADLAQHASVRELAHGHLGHPGPIRPAARK